MAMFSESELGVAGATVSNQDKIKYLKRFTLLDKEINRKVSEVERWRSKLNRVTQIYSTEPRGGGSVYGRTGDILARIVDLEKDIDADIDQLIAIRDGIKAAINAVSDDRERLLLQYRYLDGHTFEWIAAKMCYHWQWIHRLHKRALTNLEIKVCIKSHIDL